MNDLQTMVKESKELDGNSLFEKTMTVREVAAAVNVDERTIQREVSKFFPEIVKNGVKTVLTEEQVACISKDLKGHHNLDSTVEVPTTRLEILANYKKANDDFIALLEAEKQEYKQRAEIAETSVNTLIRIDEDESITKVCTRFGVQPRKYALPYLHEQGYLTTSNLPTQKAVQEGILAIKTNIDPVTGEHHEQSVVKKSMLLIWERRIIPNIKRYYELDKA